MKHVTLKLTTKELELLATLVADQLFRKEFIDPKMPGYKSNADEMSLGKTLIGRLRFKLDPVPVKRATSPRIDGATNRVAPMRRVR
jgi:DNA-binding response OmpR family regulator